MSLKAAQSDRWLISTLTCTTKVRNAAIASRMFRLSTCASERQKALGRTQKAEPASVAQANLTSLGRSSNAPRSRRPKGLPTVNKLTDCDGEASETQVWIDFALDCGYLSKENHDRLTAGYEEV